MKVNGVDVFDPRRARSAATAPTGSPAGSSTPTTTRRASSSATPTSSGRTTRTGLKTTLKAEIDAEAWATLHSDTFRPFPKPKTGRIAVKVINHLGDEVMKVFKVL